MHRLFITRSGGCLAKREQADGAPSAVVLRTVEKRDLRCLHADQLPRPQPDNYPRSSIASWAPKMVIADLTAANQNVHYDLAASRLAE